MAATRRDSGEKTASSTTEEAPERTYLRSDVEMAVSQYGLTTPEAEKLLDEGNLNQSSADELINSRVVYRTRYEVVTPPDASAVEDVKVPTTPGEVAALPNPSGADPSKPESGPYGPNADYDEVTAPVDKDHV